MNRREHQQKQHRPTSSAARDIAAARGGARAEVKAALRAEPAGGDDADAGDAATEGWAPRDYPGPPVEGKQERFRRFAQATSAATGSAGAFVLAVVVVLVWGITGPLFHYSDAWQLVINTGTTVVTFLMVFLIQATQNRDSRAVHLKLDELLRAVDAARTSMVELEDRSDADLDRIRSEFVELRLHAEREAERLVAGAEERREAAGRRAQDRVR